MKLNWRLILMGLPKRRFTPAELQRAVPEPPDASLKVAAVLNVGLIVAVFVFSMGKGQVAALMAMLGPFALLNLVALYVAWRDPSSRFAHWSYYLLPLVLGVAVGIVAQEMGVDKRVALVIAPVAVLAAFGLWFTIVYRHQFVEMRLRELDERDRAVGMAHQLAAAQIQPHFLFNSLASLQHWVHTKDDRAAPMLDALTGFLRTTLPLFDGQRLALGDEAQAVRRYLDVMQLRLGPRLQAQVDVEPAAAAVALPPGLLLTLAENAVEHGVQPSLQPVSVELRARVEGHEVVVEVVDTGAGLADGATDGVGLANCRVRLRQAFGDAARLQLHGAPGQGCTARLEIPLSPDPTLPSRSPR